MMPPPRHVAILVAVPQELAPLRRMLDGVGAASPANDHRAAFYRDVHGMRVVAMVTGVGRRRASTAAEKLLHNARPDLLVMAGVAGALSPELRVGDVIVADSVYTDTAVLAPGAVLDPTVSEARVGALLSIDRVLITAFDKHAAHSPLTPQHSQPLAVEMETAAVALAANAAGVPWAAVRAISDTAGESLPLDFNRLRSKDGDLPTSRVALAAILHPAAIPGLIRLGKHTSIAAEALASFLGEWFAAGSPIL